MRPTRCETRRSSAYLATARMTADAEDEELGVVVRVVAGVEQVLAGVGGHRPVVVLARAVDAGERLLVQQADQAVLVGGLAQDLHDQHSGGRSRGCEFSKIGAISYWLGATSLCRVLTGTPSLNSSASTSAMHASTRSGMVPKYWSSSSWPLGGLAPKSVRPAVDQVGAGVVEVLVDQEVFLLGADGGEDLLRVLVAEQARGCAGPAWTSASIERSSGVFLSSASPVQLRKAVGMTSVEPLGFSMM